MLNIYFNNSEDTLYDVDNYFNFNYDDEWLEDELVKKMILDVDKSIVKSANCIESPVLGQIAPEKLSGGVKALILMYKEPDRKYWATACGDNCAKWILKIAEINDLDIVLEHIMEFNTDFKAYCPEHTLKINNLSDYNKAVLKYL